MSSWLSLILQLIIGGFLAGIGLFVGNWFYDFYKRPQLEIKIDRKIPEEASIPIIRFKIVNEGRTAAENCNGKLTLDAERSDFSNKPTATEVTSGKEPHLRQISFRPIEKMPLNWSKKNFDESLSINAHDEEFLKFLK